MCDKNSSQIETYKSNLERERVLVEKIDCIISECKNAIECCCKNSNEKTSFDEIMESKIEVLKAIKTVILNRDLNPVERICFENIIDGIEEKMP